MPPSFTASMEFSSFLPKMVTPSVPRGAWQLCSGGVPGRFQVLGGQAGELDVPGPRRRPSSSTRAQPSWLRAAHPSCPQASLSPGHMQVKGQVPGRGQQGQVRHLCRQALGTVSLALSGL